MLCSTKIWNQIFRKILFDLGWKWTFWSQSKTLICSFVLLSEMLGFKFYQASFKIPTNKHSMFSDNIYQKYEINFYQKSLPYFSRFDYIFSNVKHRFMCKKGILTCVYMIYGEFPLQKLPFAFPPFPNVCWVIFYDFAFLFLSQLLQRIAGRIKRRNEKLRNSSSENVFHVWPTLKCLSSSFPLWEEIR